MLVKHIQHRDSTVKLKETMLERRSSGVRWIKVCEDYMKEVELHWMRMEEVSMDEMKKRCKKTSDREWRGRMGKKKSMGFYSRWKSKMGIGREWRSTKRDNNEDLAE